MKFLLYFFGVCVVLGIIFTMVLSMLPVYSTMSRGFLVAVEYKRYPEAYSLMATEFKQTHNIETFIKMTQSIGLQNYKSLSVTNQIISDDKKHAYLTGMMTTKDNKRIPIRIDFVKEPKKTLADKEWLITGVKVGN